MTDGRRHNGGHSTGPNAGRPATDLRSLDIGDVGVEFGEPVTYHADLTVVRCSCGAVGWEPYTVTVRRATEREPDANGDAFHVLASVEMAGRQMKHRKRCICG